MRRLCALALCMLLSQPVFGQGLPAHDSATINDFADLLSPSDEAALDRTLSDLRDETGVEMVVVTIAARADYPDAPGELESFATALFNTWGVGDASRNDGVMVLVVRNDREMRLELGSGYDRDFNRVARAVISDAFVPKFRDDDYPGGIAAGVDETIAQIVRPHLDTGAPLETGSSDFAGDAMFYVMVALFGAIAVLGAFGRKIRDGFATWRRCPQCGKRHLSRDRHVDQAATTSAKGQSTLTERCSNCDYKTHTTYSTSRIGSSRSSGSGGSFGGGSSSGGGASGRW